MEEYDKYQQHLRDQQLFSRNLSELEKKLPHIPEINSTIPLYIPGFTYLRTSTYDCGGQQHTVQEYLHGTLGEEYQRNSEIYTATGMEFTLIPESIIDMSKEFTVELSPYLIARTQCTQKVWQAIMNENPSYSKGENHPVEQVSWEDCQLFCQKTGLQLPTEAQWENACRAGTKTKYYWGDKMDDEYCWHYSICDETTYPVAEKKPNAFGLYDMSGNVYEWCQDYYADYPKGKKRDYVYAYDYINEEIVYRGGSRYTSDDLCGSSNRWHCYPYAVFAEAGFRACFFGKE